MTSTAQLDETARQSRQRNQVKMYAEKFPTSRPFRYNWVTVLQQLSAYIFQRCWRDAVSPGVVRQYNCLCWHICRTVQSFFLMVLVKTTRAQRNHLQLKGVDYRDDTMMIYEWTWSGYPLLGVSRLWSFKLWSTTVAWSSKTQTIFGTAGDV